MKFLGKMWLMIILSHKITGLHSLSRKHIFGKTKRKGQIDLPTAFLGLKFMEEKAGSLSASKWILYLRNMQWRGCYYRPFGFYI